MLGQLTLLSSIAGIGGTALGGLLYSKFGAHRSLFLFGLAAAPGYWWTVVGAVSITIMFAAASIPMLEKRSAERRPAWDPYLRRTSVLVPRPPRSPASS